MANSVIVHAINTISFLVFVWTGGAGMHKSVDITPLGIEVESSVPSLSVGNIAYYDSPAMRRHERGHLMHENELGTILYMPIAGLSSLYGNAQIVRGHFSSFDYHTKLWTERRANTYTERRADELGGIRRQGALK